jgi:hypothetical protein
MSAYEGEHKIFGLLGQANLTQNDEEQENWSDFPMSYADSGKLAWITSVIKELHSSKPELGRNGLQCQGFIKLQWSVFLVGKGPKVGPGKSGETQTGLADEARPIFKTTESVVGVPDGKSSHIDLETVSATDSMKEGRILSGRLESRVCPRLSFL